MLPSLIAYNKAKQSNDYKNTCWTEEAAFLLKQCYIYPAADMGLYEVTIDMNDLPTESYDIGSVKKILEKQGFEVMLIDNHKLWVKWYCPREECCNE